MKIDILCNDGSPLGITYSTIYNRGVGGAELALLSWSKEMSSRGHLVRIYNDPDKVGTDNGIEFLKKKHFLPHEPREVLIIWRSPNEHTRYARADLKVFWSCDQYTVGNYQNDIFPWVDKIVCISPFHVDYHKVHYGANESKITYTNLGVKVEDYEGVEYKKEGNQCIYCSAPDRGLNILYKVWPELVKAIPDISLIVTFDYTLWGADGPMNHEYKLKWLHESGVSFVGNIPRERLVKLQLESQLQLFPCIYDELFCISAAECQVAGALPITSCFGALMTTNLWGDKIPGNPINHNWQKQFVDTVVGYLGNKKRLRETQKLSIREAKKKFDWKVICDRWEKEILA